MSKENQIELNLIEQLKGLKYIYRPDIVDRKTLEQNFKAKFEELNRVNLTDNEFLKLREEIINSDVFLASKKLRERQYFQREDGTPLHYTLVNIKDWCKNDFEVISQLRINTENSHQRYDIILLINGLPVVQIELKKLDISPRKAMQQIVDYKNEPGNGYGNSLLCFMQLFIVSNRTNTYYFANNKIQHFQFNADEQFLPIYQLADENNKKITHLDSFTEKFLSKCTLGEMISKYMVLVESEQKLLVMRPYQIYAVKAIEECVKQNRGNGYIWHTTGSGKTLTSFKASTLLKDNHEIEKCLFVVDRKDLDRQTREEFNKFQEGSVEENTNTETLVKRLLSTDYADKVIVTTIQKLGLALDGTYKKNYKERLEPLSKKRVVFIFDECHRSQFGENHKAIKEFFPNAQLFGFTGTPIEKEDKNTQAIFGEYVDIYDIQQAVEDGATVRIFYESRLAKIELDPKAQEIIDQRIEEVTEEDELTERQQRFAKWTQQEAIVGSEKRLQQVAADIVKHFEQRSEVFDGKGMIVNMSRRICVALHNEIIKIRPEWYSGDDDKGVIKVIMTGSSSDPLDWQEHIRNKPRRKAIGDRLRDPKDPLKLVLVRDMWLTGFDAPCLHTLYVDKPMTGHNLMQAIARVNRVFKDKEGGLIVDYLGIAQDLKKALSVYTSSGGKGKIEFDQEEAVAKMEELYEIVVDLFYGFDYKRFFTLQPREKLTFLLDATDFILGLDKGQERFSTNISNLSKAFAISVPHPKAIEIRDDLSFFQAIKARISKLRESNKKRSDEEVETAIRQIISDALISTEVIDIFQAAGLHNPEISGLNILSDEFMAELKDMPRKNLALELLRRLLNDEIKQRSQRNIIQSKKFSEMLADAIKRYQNNAITAAEIIEELIRLAKEIKEADKRGENLNLDFRELAFYDALEVSDSAVQILGDDILKTIARELVVSVRNSVTIDWDKKESVQAKMRVMIKRILKKYGYPPEKQDQAVKTILEQAKMIADDFSNNK